MTKKDYIIIADSLAQAFADGEMGEAVDQDGERVRFTGTQQDMILEPLITRLALNNPLFDRQRFIDHINKAETAILQH